MDWNNQGKQPPQVNIDQYIQRMLEDPKRVIMLILLAIAVWGVLSSFYLVDTQQRAVITRFGRFVRTEGPGPHLMIPFGVERKQIVFTEQVQQEAFGTFDPANDMRSRYQRNLEHEASMLTGDLNVVEVKWVVQYFITDPKAYLFNVAEPQKNIRDISQAVMRRVVGDRLVSSVMHDFSEVQIKATDLTQKIFDEYEMGVSLEEIKVQSVEPPQIVRPAFNEVNAAKQQQERDINLAEKEKNSVIPAAKGQAEREISEAKGYSTALLNRAKGDADRIANVLAAYNKAPEVTRIRLYLELVEDVLQRVKSLTVVDPTIKGLLPIFDTLNQNQASNSKRAQANFEKFLQQGEANE